MWHVYGSQTTSPLNTMIDEFNRTVGKENGITINVVSVTSSSAIDDVLLNNNILNGICTQAQSYRLFYDIA